MRIMRAGPLGQGSYSVLIWELIHSLFSPLTHEMDYTNIHPHLSLLLPTENETLDTSTSRLPLSMRGSGDIYGLMRAFRALMQAPVIKEWFQSHYTTPPRPKRPLQHLPQTPPCTSTSTHQQKHIHEQKTHRFTMMLQNNYYIISPNRKNAIMPVQSVCALIFLLSVTLDGYNWEAWMNTKWGGCGLQSVLYIRDGYGWQNQSKHM